MIFQVLAMLIIACAFWVGLRGKADKTLWRAAWVAGLLAGFGIAVALLIYAFDLPFRPDGNGSFVLDGEILDKTIKVTVGLVGGRHVRTLKGFCLLYGAEWMAYPAALWLGFGLRRLWWWSVDLYYELTAVAGW
jgi:hypothetical protein